MAKLAPGDFSDSDKKASGGQFENKTFKFIAAQKIKQQIAFTLGDENGKKVLGFELKEVKGKKTTQYFLEFADRKLSFSQQKKLQTLDPESPLLISKFFKDKDFGGGGGSGGGAADTAINESLQCFYCSILFNTGADTLTPANCTEKALYAQSKYCFTYAKKGADRYGTSLKDFRKKLYDVAENKKPTASNWIEDKNETGQNVYMRIAQGLYASAAAKPFKGKTVYFHRASDWMNAIYTVKERALDFDKTDAKEAGKAPLSGLSDDKWNPGDIWLSTIGGADQNPNASGEGNSPLCFNNEKKSDCSTFELLKNQVLKEAQEGKLLAVSLKKVGTKANIQEFNTKDRTNNENVIYDGFVFGQTGNFFSSADMYLHFKQKGTMQLRSTATTKSWQGEMKGALASGGKIGGGGINYYMETTLKKSIGFGEIKGAKAWSEKKIVDKGDMYDLYVTYNKKQMGDFKNVTFENKNADVKDEDGQWVKTDIVPIVRFSIANRALAKAYDKLDKKEFRLIDKAKDKGYNRFFTQYIIKENSRTAKQGYVNRKDFDILAKNYTAKGKNASPAFYFSKYMNLLFLDALYTATENPQKDQTIDEYSKQIVRYAMSNTDISTYFIKIY